MAPSRGEDGDGGAEGGGGDGGAAAAAGGGGVAGLAGGEAGGGGGAGGRPAAPPQLLALAAVAGNAQSRVGLESDAVALALLETEDAAGAACESDGFAGGADAGGSTCAGDDSGGRGSAGGAGDKAGTDAAERQGATNRYAILVTLLSGRLALSSSFSVLNLLLTDLAADLGSTRAAAVWATLAPLLVSASLLAAGGKLGDTLGYKRMWLLGYGVHIVTTACSALAPNVPLLVAARAVQGVGMALDAPSGVALLVRAFPARDRALVLGVHGAVGAAGQSAGLVVGGAIAQFFGWRAVFWAPLPFTALSFIIAARILDPALRGDAKQACGVPGAAPTPREMLREFDYAGALTLALATLALLLGMNRAGAHGADAPTVACLLAFPVLGALLLRIERHAVHPVLPMRALGDARLAYALAAFFMLFLSYLGVWMLYPLFLRDFAGQTSAAAAALLCARPVCNALFAPLTGQLIKHRVLSDQRLLLGGTFLLGVSFVLTLGIAAQWDNGSGSARGGPALSLGPVVQSVVFVVCMVCQGAGLGVSATVIRTHVTEVAGLEVLASMQGLLQKATIITLMIGTCLSVAMVPQEVANPWVPELAQRAPYLHSAAVYLATFALFCAFPAYYCRGGSHRPGEDAELIKAAEAELAEVSVRSDSQARDALEVTVGDADVHDDGEDDAGADDENARLLGG